MPAILAAGVIIAVASVAIPSHRDYTVKAKLAHVLSVLEPVKAAAVAAYRDKGSMPAMHTIVTAANQGKPATPDWVTLGFKQFPELPPQIKRLEFSGQESPEIVVELDNIGESFDGTTVRAKLIAADGKLSWHHEATASDPMAAHFVHSYDGAVREPHAPGREAKCPP